MNVLKTLDAQILKMLDARILEVLDAQLTCRMDLWIVAATFLKWFLG